MFQYIDLQPVVKQEELDSNIKNKRRSWARVEVSAGELDKYSQVYRLNLPSTPKERKNKKEDIITPIF